MGGGSRSGAKEAEGEWEVRPGGMLVQRRDGEEGPTVRLRVSHGPALRDVFVPAQATFGELKRVLAQTTGLEPERQRLFFRGKEKRDDEFLHASGAKDGAKLLLLEKHVPANVEQKVEPVMMDESMMRACEAVVRVRSEVDKLSAKVCELEKSVLAGRKVEEKEFVVLTELLMVQLLKLDGIEAEGEARAQRKAEKLARPQPRKPQPPSPARLRPRKLQPPSLARPRPLLAIATPSSLLNVAWSVASPAAPPSLPDVSSSCRSRPSPAAGHAPSAAPASSHICIRAFTATAPQHCLKFFHSLETSFRKDVNIVYSHGCTRETYIDARGCCSSSTKKGKKKK